MTYAKLSALAAVILVSCFSFCARAADDPPPDTFRNWNAMRDYATSQGIDTMTIDWPEIEQLCGGLKTQADETAYNKCGYEKAVEQYTFVNDRSECLTQATGDYPDDLLTGRVETRTETDRRGIVHTYQHSISGISAATLQQRRSGAITACMQKLGWVNANNWRLGKHTTPCQ